LSGCSVSFQTASARLSSRRAPIVASPRYVAALGGKLEVVAVFPDERVDLEVPGEGAAEGALAESE